MAKVYAWWPMKWNYRSVCVGMFDQSDWLQVGFLGTLGCLTSWSVLWLSFVSMWIHSAALLRKWWTLAHLLACSGLGCTLTMLTINPSTLKSIAMSLYYDIIHCSEQVKARTAYKLKNYWVRLGRYSNQICFQCASQATTCQKMGQSPSPSQECSRMCLHGHKGMSKERQIRKSDILRSQGT